MFHRCLSLHCDHDVSAKSKVPVALQKDKTMKIPPQTPKISSSRYDADSSLRLYMREISETPLLTSKEEIELAALIRKGDQDARTRKIKANLRLVVKIAQDYSNYGLPLMDLISEGNIGLMKAVERFDPAKGGKLSTYGSWWIKQSIKRALANQSKTIRLPVHMVDKIAKLRRVMTLLTESYGREPTDEELCGETGMAPKKLSLLKRAAQRPTSLDSPVGDEERSSFAEIIGDEHAENPFEVLSDKNMLNQIDSLLEVLDERESKIIKARYGLSGKNAMTLEEVGREFKVTRERIRQLQNIALDKMRKSLRIREKPKEVFLARKAS